MPPIRLSSLTSGLISDDIYFESLVIFKFGIVGKGSNVLRVIYLTFGLTHSQVVFPHLLVHFVLVLVLVVLVVVFKREKGEKRPFSFGNFFSC